MKVWVLTFFLFDPDEPIYDADEDELADVTDFIIAVCASPDTAKQIATMFLTGTYHWISDGDSVFEIRGDADLSTDFRYSGLEFSDATIKAFELDQVPTRFVAPIGGTK